MPGYMLCEAFFTLSSPTWGMADLSRLGYTIIAS